MKKKFNAVLSYLAMFLIGGYFTSYYHFNTPVEAYRWLLTSFFFGFFAVRTFNTKEK